MNSSNNVQPFMDDAIDLDDANTMDIDMDIDLGLDFNVDAEAEAEAMNIEQVNVPSSPSDEGEITAESEARDAAEAARIQGADIAAEKIHIRGLDNLTTDDIYNFVGDHFSASVPKIEWIDDTSANVVYGSTSIAGAALRAFTYTDNAQQYPEDPLELRPAKSIPSHPHIHLTIRLALLSDKKAPRAGDASRFYLLNPDKDPREQRRRHNGYDSRRGGYGGPRKRRRDEDVDEEKIEYDENMYDDDPTALAARIMRPLASGPGPDSRRRSDDRDLFDRRPIRDNRDRGYYREREREREPKRTRRSSNDDLFARTRRLSNNSVSTTALPKSEGTYGRLRDRSASPLRASDGDGRHGFAETEANSRALPSDLARRIRTRSQTPPSARVRRTSHANSNVEKERDLFASRIERRESVLLTPNGHGTANGSNGSRELFPRLTPGSNSRPRISGHQRSDALDARDEVHRSGGGKGRDLFARVNGGSGLSLADRITGGPGGGGGDAVMDLGNGNGFSIKGSAMDKMVEDENPGFSIRGLGANHKRVKELFPEKAGEKGRSGRDLFAGRLKGGGALEGRISGRRTAADLFS